MTVATAVNTITSSSVLANSRIRAIAIFGAG
jgi:hypothetical protein